MLDLIFRCHVEGEVDYDICGIIQHPHFSEVADQPEVEYVSSLWADVDEGWAGYGGNCVFIIPTG